MPATAPRTRLTPEARRENLLDVARQAILRDGLSTFTIEGLGREAGVSKALVYVYFRNREALFADLLRQEEAELRARAAAGASRAEGFAEVIRATTRAYLEQSRDRGALIALLMADPAVARLMAEETRQAAERTVGYFVGIVRKEYALSLEQAAAAVSVLMPLTGQAGRAVSHGAMEIDAAVDLCVTLIVGGLEALARR